LTHKALQSELLTASINKPQAYLNKFGFFDFPLITIIPPVLHIHLSPPPEVGNIPDKAAHYALQLKDWVTSQQQLFAAYDVS
jgi:hypothetical protein